ncbi:hypothetical protein D3C81_1867400 [compost metagenome]
MDIAAASTTLSQSVLAQSVGIQVLNMANNQAVQQGIDLVSMVEQNIHPSLGKSLDIKI